jgi:hypothetical protein
MVAIEHPTRVSMRLKSQLSSFLTGLIIAVASSVAAQPAPSASPYAVTNDAAFFSLIDLDRPELSQVHEAVLAADWPRAKRAWASHLAIRQNPRWIWSRHDRAKIAALYANNFGGLARYTNAANLVLARDFNLLGVRKQLTPKIDWLQGPNEWTHVLSRFGYWNDLGRAYWGTGDAAYARDFADLLTQWTEANPVPAVISNDRGPRGSVWRTLEAGIRGQGWFEAMEFFMDAPEFNAEAKFRMTKSLVEHARYLDAWTTKYRSGNWQVCEASGLATIGIMLPEFKAAAEWRKRGLDMLMEHLQRDVEPDGSHWELTPGYHGWVMREFLQVARLCEINGIAMGEFRARHEKMFEVLLKLCRPNGTLPPVGDGGTGNTRIADNMGLGALLYQRTDFRHFAADDCAEDWVWLLGPDSCAQIAKQKSALPNFTSVLLPDAKYAVMRSGWGPDDQYLLFDCAPWRGGHSHQDRLQVTVFAGRDLIVDSGMISYDNPASPPLRKSAAHSVLVIDGREQIHADPQLLTWHTDAQADFASGVTEAGDLRHQRSVLYLKPGYWVVADEVGGNGEHEVTRLFQFAPGEVKHSGQIAETAFPEGMNIRVQPLDDAQLELRRGTVGASLVEVKENSIAALTIRGRLPRVLGTVLLPFRDARQLPQVKSLPANASGELHLELSFSNGQRDEIVIARDARTLRIGEQQTNALALIVRRGPVSESVVAVPAGIQP